MKSSSLMYFFIFAQSFLLAGNHDKSFAASKAILKDAHIDHVSNKHGGVLVFFEGKNFAVEEDKEFKNIQHCFIDHILKRANKENFTNLQKQVWISVHKEADGSYGIKAHPRLNGGGPGGASAGVWIGWTVTNVVGHGVIFVACRGADLVAPGSGAAAEVGLHAAAAPLIATTAKAVAIGTGILGAIFTGPA